MKWVRKKVGREVNFLRVDISSPVGKAVVRKYAIPLNSAYLIFDQEGNEVWRSFAIPLNGRKVVRILQKLLNS